MGGLSTILADVLDWLTQVASWILMPANVLYLTGFGIAIAGMVIGLMRRTFRRA